MSWIVNDLLRNITQDYSRYLEYLFIMIGFLIVALFQCKEVLFVLLLFIGLFSLSILDIFHRILPDVINFILLFLGLVLSFQSYFISTKQAILGILFGYLIPSVVSLIYRNITGQLGMGGGDIKLSAALGSWLGFENILYVLFWSSLIGCIFYCVMVMKGEYNKNSEIPFGLFLSIVGLGTFLIRFSL